MTNEEYEEAVLAAEKDLSEAKTKEDVATAWERHYLTLGHKAMGRLLLGKKAADLAERRAERVGS